jgi:hypothetical protein
MDMVSACAWGSTVGIVFSPLCAQSVFQMLLRNVFSSVPFATLKSRPAKLEERSQRQ